MKRMPVLLLALCLCVPMLFACRGEEQAPSSNPPSVDENTEKDPPNEQPPEESGGLIVEENTDPSENEWGDFVPYP